jgi:hypothetical protein
LKASGRGRKEQASIDTQTIKGIMSLGMCGGPPGSSRDGTGEMLNDTNGKGAWDLNDWCWVIEFRVGK